MSDVGKGRGYACVRVGRIIETSLNEPPVPLPAAMVPNIPHGCDGGKVVYPGAENLRGWQAHALTTISTSQGRQRAFVRGWWEEGN